ncbi:MAG: exo-alpha-sialidase [Bacteroidales bacterium]|nr:exo-alpha-sialidase [Bacteroidales bacterium]
MSKTYLFLVFSVLFLASCSGPDQSGLNKVFAELVGDNGLSPVMNVYKVNRDLLYNIGGEEYFIGAGFQPSVLPGPDGAIHIFFQARLGGSGDRAPKLIAHIVSTDGGKSFSGVEFVNEVPMQTYAISSFFHVMPSGANRISLLTSLSIDETMEGLKDTALINQLLGIDVTRFSRKGAALILEYYSDDLGATWKRKEHYDITDRVYHRNGKEYYLAFMNLIGQVRRIDDGPFKGRLILGGPLRGSYLPCEDYAHFRDYQSSSSVIFSDDNGESWTFGGVISDSTAFVHNEASAVPVDFGSKVLLVRRSNKRGVKGKTMHYSKDGGETWGDGFLSSIPATQCLQVLESTKDLVLCSMPANRNRSEGSIFVSDDNGISWTSRLIEEGAFSYSTVNHLSGDYYICCYSQGHHGQIGIKARIFSKAWLVEK